MNYIGSKNMINEIVKHKIVAFDVFETLLLRKVNQESSLFDLIGQKFCIHGFKKIRKAAQRRADRIMYEEVRHDCADINLIYKMLEDTRLKNHTWDLVKEYELETIKKSSAANKEVQELYTEAKKNNKRVIAIADTYLPEVFIQELLIACGYEEIDHVYCSCDEKKTKTDNSLWEEVQKQEKCEDIVYIGTDVKETGEGFGSGSVLADKKPCYNFTGAQDAKETGESPGSGTVLAVKYDMHDIKKRFDESACTVIDNGIYRILAKDYGEPWYNFGVGVAGPVYLGIYDGIKGSYSKTGKETVFFHDDHIVYKVLKQHNCDGINYIDISEAEFLLAGTDCFDTETIELLYEYYKGNTVRDIFNFLSIDTDRINLTETGLVSFDDELKEKGILQKICSTNAAVILDRCNYERKRLIKELEKENFAENDHIVFNCGWNGSLQFMVERALSAISREKTTYFIYLGIESTKESRYFLAGKKYQTLFFDFCKNYKIQRQITASKNIYEYFLKNTSKNILKSDERDRSLDDILNGINDYLGIAIEFSREFHIEHTPDLLTGHMNHMVSKPLEKEAKAFGIEYKKGFKKNPDKSEIEANAFGTENKNGFKNNADKSEKEANAFGIEDKKGFKKNADKYNLENTNDLIKYRRWMRKHKLYETQELDHNPMFSVVMPVSGAAADRLKCAINSIVSQTYHNFELMIVDDCSLGDGVSDILHEYENKEHIKIIYKEINDAIAMAGGDFLAFMDCNDYIEPNTLYEAARMLNEKPGLDFIYTDEDKVTEDGKIKHYPFFKPDWSPDLHWCQNYTGHFSVYRMSIVSKTGGLRSEYNGSQYYDFLFRFMENTCDSKVGHIKKILYHKRELTESAAYAANKETDDVISARDARIDAIKRRKIAGHLEYICDTRQYRIVYDPVGNPGISIVIPSKDHYKILSQCIDSIKEYTTYQNYEIIVVDNGSNDRNKGLISDYLSENGCKYIYGEYAFSYSKMCNLGAAVAEKDYLLFLNDDIEIIQEDWLERMAGQIIQPHVGTVGAKLLYPDTTLIQHGGVCNNKDGPAHIFYREDDSDTFFFDLNRADIDCIAVTGACLLISKALFNDIEGFDEGFPVNYNDTDLCFRVHERGYYNVVRQDVIAFHHESISRGSDLLDKVKFLKLSHDRQRLYLKHPEISGPWDRDPFLNDNLRYNSGVRMDIADNYDEVTVLNDAGSLPQDNAFIDSVTIADDITIYGWSFLPDRCDNESYERFMTFEDVFGYRYKAPVVNYRREDLVEAFGGRSDIEMCGFECRIKKEFIRADIVPYKLGVQTIDKNGQSYIYWENKYQHVMRNEYFRPEYVGFSQIGNYSFKDAGKAIDYYIDSCVRNEDGIRIEGWAYCEKSFDYKYRKTIILKGEWSTAKEFEITEIERVDVALENPRDKFICKTGFLCYILPDILEDNEKYELILRFCNVYDENDINDVMVYKI